MAKSRRSGQGIDIHHPKMVKTVFILTSLAILAFLALIVKSNSFSGQPQAGATCSKVTSKNLTMVQKLCKPVSSCKITEVTLKGKLLYYKCKSISNQSANQAEVIPTKKPATAGSNEDKACRTYFYKNFPNYKTTNTYLDKQIIHREGNCSGSEHTFYDTSWDFGLKDDKGYTVLGHCCVPIAKDDKIINDLYDVNDLLCKNKYGGSVELRCKIAGCKGINGNDRSGQYTYNLTSTCDYADAKTGPSKTKLNNQKNNCCGVPPPTNTPKP